MRLTVLGRWGAYPEAGEATAGYLLEAGGQKILVDCGSGVLANLLKHRRLEELDAVFLSHYHHDHCADVGCLQYASKFALNFKKRVTPLPIYAHRQAAAFSELNFGEYTVGREIAPGLEMDLQGVKVTFFPTVHEAYNLALRFEAAGKAFVYTGDLGPATPITDFCAGADLLLCETSLFEHEAGLFPGHMTTRQTGELASRAGVKELMLTHFPHLGDISKMPAEAGKYFKGRVRLAEMNKQLDF
jgi:ribonuclease BN (tRNA processing enzyme)